MEPRLEVLLPGSSFFEFRVPDISSAHAQVFPTAVFIITKGKSNKGNEGNNKLDPGVYEAFPF